MRIFFGWELNNYFIEVKMLLAKLDWAETVLLNFGA
jgi:hypothetical protein